MVTYMVMVSAASIGDIPNANAAISKNIMAVLDNFSPIFKIG
jgi:hypothetical protein